MSPRISLRLRCGPVPGLLSFSVAQRAREIGVRLALGAQAHDIIALVLRQTLWIVGVGVLLGLTAALSGVRLLGALLYGDRPARCADACGRTERHRRSRGHGLHRADATGRESRSADSTPGGLTALQTPARIYRLRRRLNLARGFSLTRGSFTPSTTSSPRRCATLPRIENRC